MRDNSDGLSRVFTLALSEAGAEREYGFADGFGIVVGVALKVPMERGIESVFEGAAYEIHGGIVSLASPGSPSLL